MGDFLDIFALHIHDEDNDGEGEEYGWQQLGGEEDQTENDESSSSYPYVHTLHNALYHLAQPMPMPLSMSTTTPTEQEQCDADRNTKSYFTFLTNILQNHMGSMAQCRIGSTEIREGDGITSLMKILCKMVNVYLPQVPDEEEEEDTKKEIYYGLTIAVLGALRDLACGNAQNRLQIGQFQQDNDKAEEECQFKTSESQMSGIDILSYFIKKYDSPLHYYSWEEISGSKLELKTMTNALGVIRNISHSTPSNCLALHQAGMTRCLIERLLEGGSSHHDASESANSNVTTMDTSERYALPDVTKPWREACYRTAGSLVNMAERCHDVAKECAGDEALIWILIQSWGGFEFGDKEKSNFGKKSSPVLHIGLGNVLNERIELVGGEAVTMRSSNSQSTVTTPEDNNSNANCAKDERMVLMDVIQDILDREDKRKRTAQEREIARKKAKALKI